MDILIKQSTKSTPLVKFYVDAHILVFEGVSYPVNPMECYKPVLDWINDYLRAEPQPLIIRFDLKYINTSSTRFFLNMFRIIDTENIKRHPIKIEWLCEQDNDMAFEYGNFFKEQITTPFEIVPL